MVSIALTIAALNRLDILACDVQNAYLIALCRKNIWAFAELKFGEEEGTLILVKIALYGVNLSGAVFRSKLAGVLRDIG